MPSDHMARDGTIVDAVVYAVSRERWGVVTG